MTTVLDEILAVANGGHTTDKIQQYVSGVVAGKKRAMAIQEELQAAIDKHGVHYVVQMNSRGSPEILVTIPNKPYTVPSDMLVTITNAKKDNFSTDQPFQVCSVYSTPDVHHMIKAGAKVCEQTNTSITFLIDKAIAVVNPAVECDSTFLQYEGDSPREVKDKLAKEVLNLLSTYKQTHSYHTGDQLHNAFLRNNILGYSPGNNLNNRLTLADYRNLIKLLFPTVRTRECGKDLSKEIIRKRVAAANILPRDFGIRNVDTLLIVWAGLLKQSLAEGFDKDSPASHKIDDLVAFITKHGGTLHGGKVGSRINFKQEVSNG